MFFIQAVCGCPRGRLHTNLSGYYLGQFKRSKFVVTEGNSISEVVNKYAIAVYSHNDTA